MPQNSSRPISERLGRNSKTGHRDQPSAVYVPRNICKFFMKGICTRNSCPFLHPDKAATSKSVSSSNSLQSKPFRNLLKPTGVVNKRLNEEQNIRKVWHRTLPDGDTQKRLVKCSDLGSSEKSSNNQKNIDVVTQNDGSAQNPSALQKDDCPEKVLKICNDWINKSCVYGEKCKYLHSWSSSNEFRKIAQLEGHLKAVTGINLPEGSDKLLTSSEDGTIRTWNCHTGECIGVVGMGSPVWCLESEGPWVFAGITNAIKAWNFKTCVELTLNAPGGQVHSLVFSDKTLFGGLQDGSIFRWKLNSDDTSFDSPTILKGHTGAVVSLFWGADRVYSGSLDKTVRVWDRKSLLCIHTLQKHSEEIMSVLCWDNYLLSSSLDKTLKIWAAAEVDKMEAVYTHNEEHGIILLNGMHDAAKKPILLCSCSDNSARLYDLPSFHERGRIFAKDEISAIHIGPRGQFFTGDKTGTVSVWLCSGDFLESPDVVAA